MSSLQRLPPSIHPFPSPKFRASSQVDEFSAPVPRCSRSSGFEGQASRHCRPPPPPSHRRVAKEIIGESCACHAMPSSRSVGRSDSDNRIPLQTANFGHKWSFKLLQCCTQHLPSTVVPTYSVLAAISLLQSLKSFDGRTTDIKR